MVLRRHYWSVLLFIHLTTFNTTLSTTTLNTTLSTTTLNTTLSTTTLNTTLSTTTLVLPKIDFCKVKILDVNLIILVFLIFFIVLTVVGNLCVIVVIITSSKLRQNGTFKLLLSLAVSDFLIGFIVMPVNAKRIYNNRFFCMPKEVCWLILVVSPLISFASVTHLFAIGLERYFALKYTFRFAEIMTPKRFILGIFIMWTYCMILASLGVVNWNQKDGEPSHTVYFKINRCSSKSTTAYITTTYLIFHILPILVMVFTYLFVYKTAIRHIKEIAKTQIERQSVKDMRRKKRQLKTFRSVVLVFVCFLVCNVPLLSLYFFVTYARSTFDAIRRKYQDAVHIFLIIIADILPPFNSTTNPFIYVASNKQFRKRMKEILHVFPCARTTDGLFIQNQNVESRNEVYCQKQASTRL